MTTQEKEERDRLVKQVKLLGKIIHDMVVSNQAA